jgi:hypothetical protein
MLIFKLHLYKILTVKNTRRDGATVVQTQRYHSKHYSLDPMEINADLFIKTIRCFYSINPNIHLYNTHYLLSDY